MRRLQHKVNIVPIIAKADALTAAELRAFKERIMSDFDRYKIDIYRLPECDSDEEEEIKRLDKEIKVSHTIRLLLISLGITFMYAFLTFLGFQMFSSDETFIFDVTSFTGPEDVISNVS